MVSINSFSFVFDADRILSSSFYYRKGSKVLRFLVILFLAVMFLLFSPVSAQDEDENTCTQNCSWDYYDGSTKQWTTQRCELRNPENRLYSDGHECPVSSVKEEATSFPARVENFSVSFYSKPSGYEDETTLCANITFRIGREGIEHVRGLRIAVKGKTYLSINKNYCQYWDFPSSLSPCAVSQGQCSLNSRVRTFYYDCLCGLPPGQGVISQGYQVSVDTLPKVKDVVQKMTLFEVPACEQLEKNEHCVLSAKENWRPLYSRLEQICDLPALSLTFDLPPPEMQVNRFRVLIFEHNFDSCEINGMAPVVNEVYQNLDMIDTFEEMYYNQSFNMTSFTHYENVNYTSSYLLVTRILDNDYTYNSQLLCDTTVRVEYPPCDPNPCDVTNNEICIADCLELLNNTPCHCNSDFVRDNLDRCVPANMSLEQWTAHEGATIMDAHVEETHSNIGVASAWSMAFGVLLLVVAVISVMSFIVVVNGRSSRTNGDDKLSKIGLICNSNKHLLKFARDLGEALKKVINSPVEVITVTDPSEFRRRNVGANEKNCFIMDNSLSTILCDDPDGTTGSGGGGDACGVVCKLVESLKGENPATVILLQFDFSDFLSTSSSWCQEYPIYRLPSQWSQFVKELDSASGSSLSDTEGNGEALAPSYQTIRNTIQENIYQQSIRRWMYSPESERDESVASVFNMSTVDSLGEEEAKDELYQSMTFV